MFTTLATVAGQRAATRPVLDAQSVYFADPGRGAVYRVAKDGSYVVVRIPVSSGAPVTLGTAAGAEVLALAVDDSGVYFTSSGVVWTLPLGGGTPVALTSDDGDLDAVVTNDADLFWTASPACDVGSNCGGRVERLSPK